MGWMTHKPSSRPSHPTSFPVLFRHSNGSRGYGPRHDSSENQRRHHLQPRVQRTVQLKKEECTHQGIPDQADHKSRQGSRDEHLSITPKRTLETPFRYPRHGTCRGRHTPFPPPHITPRPSPPTSLPPP